MCDLKNSVSNCKTELGQTSVATDRKQSQGEQSYEQVIKYVIYSEFNYCASCISARLVL